MEKKKHIVILCSRLDLPGGTERAICNFANLFSTKGHLVQVIVLDNTANSFYPLEKKITVIAKPLHFGITKTGNMVSRKYAFYRHIGKLKSIIKKIQPDIVISTDYPFSVAAVLGGLKKFSRLVSWEPHHFYWLKKNRFWSYLFNKTYPKLDIVVCLNETEKKIFEQLGCRTIVIPGFIPDFPDEQATLNSKEMLTVGWFIERKGIDLVPLIAKLIFQKHPDWKWKLVGKGEGLTQLTKAIIENGLENNMVIVPPVGHRELEEIYSHASLYIMTSRFEGFPAVLIESMAHGVPCISFDCPTGPSDIIRHGIDGILVKKENTVAMAEAINSLIEDNNKRKTMGRLAFQNIRRFSPESVYELWARLF